MSKLADGIKKITDKINEIKIIRIIAGNKHVRRILRAIFTIAFFIFLGLFINEVAVQPYLLRKSLEKARELYGYGEAETMDISDHSDSSDGSIPGKNGSGDNMNPGYDTGNDPYGTNNGQTGPDSGAPASTPDPNRDDKGRLKKFSKLLEVNEDVKGWIRITNIKTGKIDTKVDYVVVQSPDKSDPDFYLSRNWATKDYLKAGSIFLDVASSVENNSKNLIIHGHNMTSSDNMFHYLLEYKDDIKFLKEHPIIRFDTIYEEALWKIFAVYITPGNNDKGDFFPFTTAEFKSDKDFIEFIYQTRLRSFYYMDSVDINENDQILTLSTCSYELPNYRLVIVARKVREGEDSTVDTSVFKKKKSSERLYPQSFYDHYGGKPPEILPFDEAVEKGLVPWYKPNDSVGDE